MANIIEARVRQKVGTLQEWNNNPLILLGGEQAVVLNGNGLPVNIKYGDGTKRFSDLPFWINYDQGAYSKVSTTVLPASDGAIHYSIVGSGTYTQTAGGSVIVPVGSLGIISNNGTTWSLDQTVVLPTVEVVDGFDSISITEAGSANNDRILKEGQVSTILGDKIGVQNPSLEGVLIFNNTRINTTPILTSGQVKLNAYFPETGTGKIKLFTKNIDGTYNYVSAVNISFNEGVNSYNIFVLENQYIGFYGTASVTGSNFGSVYSATLQGDNIGVNQVPIASNFVLQFNYQYIIDIPLKDKVSDLSDEVGGMYSNSTIDDKDDLVLLSSKEYSDDSIYNYNVLDSTLFNGNNGVEVLNNGITSGNSRTRINNELFGGAFDIINIGSFQFNCFQAGTIKVIICTKSSSDVFTNVKSITKSCTVGLNTLTNQELTSLSGLPSGSYYVAFYMNSTSSVGSINQPAPRGWYVTSDITSSPATSMGTSTLQIQFKMSYVGIKNNTVKSSLSDLYKTQGKAIYVSKLGSDTLGDGNKGLPYLTINKAISMSIGIIDVKIIIGAGDYRETLDFSSLTFENVNLVKTQRDVVRILGSDQLSTFTKTSGYVNIYQCPFSKSIATWTRVKNPIFEDKRPSRLILDLERNPLQRGLTHRLPFTPIESLDFNTDLPTTLLELDSQSGKYYYDIANSILYIHSTDSSNPNTNGFKYEVPVRDCNIAPSVTILDSRPCLLMGNIQFMFLKRGFSSNGFEKVSRNRCAIMGVAADGIVSGGWRDDTSQVYSYKDEVAYCDGDGVNGHYNIYTGHASMDMREGAGLCEYVDIWSHDNLDDGMSHHERHDVSLFGGLFEYNGDRGVVPAQGCQMTAYDVISRKNGQDPLEPSSGEGFAVVNVVNDGRNGTKLTVFNCISDGNRRGYVSRDDVKNLLISINCVSRNNITSEYSASYGTLIAKNCKVTNESVSKYKITTNGGIILVENDSELT